MLYKVIRNIVQHIQSFQFHCTTAVVSCTIRTMLYTILYTRSAPAYPAPLLLRPAGPACALCINARPGAPSSCRLHHCCAARAKPPRRRSQPERRRARLVHLRSHACTETGVGCWDRIASLSIFALLLPIQLPRQLCQRWCRSPALEAAPASWLQHQPSRSGSSKELCPIRGGWC